METLVIEVLIILALVLFNGYLALAELAVVSSRLSRLREMAERRVGGAQAAVALAENPSTFLSAIQVGITLVGILAGVYGGAALASTLAVTLASIPAVAPFAYTLALVLVVSGVTYLTLIVGELVPKRIALAHPERWAVRLAPSIRVLATIATPAVWLLSKSSDCALWALRVRPPERHIVTDEEVRMLIEEGLLSGSFESTERDIVDRLFRMSDRRVGALVIPRADVVWLDIAAPQEEAVATVLLHGCQDYLVAEESIDRVRGVVRARDIMARLARQEPLALADMLRAPLVFPEGMRALVALDTLRKSGEDLALVIDEYGETEGVVTLTDILESLVGEIGPPEEEPEIVRRPDGTLLLDGMLAVDELKDLLDVEELPDQESGYRTLAGFVLTALGRIPSVGDSFAWGRFRFVVVDMDGHRIDRVQVTPMALPEDDTV